MPVVVATAVPSSLSAARAADNLPSPSRTPDQPPSSQSQPPSKRKRKRPRVKGKKRVVLTAEQLPQQKRLRNGRVRSYDMSIPQQQPDKQPPMSRSQREFAALLSATNQPKAARSVKQTKEKRYGDLIIKPGETQQQFMNRVKQDTRKQVLAIARRDNKQRIKKRAYYERREQRMLRRKKRRNGELSDSDVEQITDTQGTTTAPGVNLSQLPLYWQDIVRNNGRPVSKKKKSRQEQQDIVKFGEQVQRPPKLENVVVRHRQRKP
ncbi:hypothetical protein FGB62_16g145 [Gracilaria domingensis]|nr:hypothetical protein FGB62_16g145 [Gracilaria domingensis]